jgi:hypothetical protein
MARERNWLAHAVQSTVTGGNRDAVSVSVVMIGVSPDQDSQGGLADELGAAEELAGVG